jgi:3-oxoacyl-[acyl-carrier-protein] synthase II
MFGASLPLIAGLGLLTPLGNLEQTWSALHAGRAITGSGVVDSDAAGVPIRPMPADHPTPRIFHLALAAARQACASIPADILHDPDTALVVGTSKGPMDCWITPLPHMSTATYVIGGLQPAGLGDLASSLAGELGIRGPRLTYCGACASGLHALARAGLMIRSGEASHALVVAAESSLHPLFLASYQRLGVLAGPEGCRPFDQRRTGFRVSEAAAAIFLSACDPNLSTSPTLQFPIILDRAAIAGDATHLTNPDPDGQTLAHLIRTVLAGQPCDLIHAHGTGTIANDPVELSAIEACLPASGPKPLLYSHKAALGHTLGASGLISAVLNCLAHRDGIIPGNIRTTSPMAVRRVRLGAQPTQSRIARSLALAAGFGGSMAAACLKTLR